ncbi:GNAT family N-acetyltransferase [Aquimarina celericrescens]|uniref:GNAT family N-acetyltransferase n=1 Tax=Aquimarina celericrescens TaxID=1964542 RepID=A0ABW5ASE5_9FLAO|nr:GNAT family N-acetyltransferase [Aquimarina celericrescens]
MITIKVATLDDAESISFLGKKTFDQSFGHLFHDRIDLTSYLNETFSYEKISNSISKTHNIYWIVYKGNLSVGYAKLKLNSSSKFIKSDKICKLQKIYLCRGTSSKGIGSVLQQIIFDKAIDQGNEHLWLSVLKQNKRAITFYDRNKYQIVGDHSFIIGKQKFDFWVMSKKLIN